MQEIYHMQIKQINSKKKNILVMKVKINMLVLFENCSVLLFI